MNLSAVFNWLMPQKGVSSRPSARPPRLRQQDQKTGQVARTTVPSSSPTASKDRKIVASPLPYATEEIWFHIVGFLGQKGRSAVGATCTTLGRISKDPKLPPLPPSTVEANAQKIAQAIRFIGSQMRKEPNWARLFLDSTGAIVGIKSDGWVYSFLQSPPGCTVRFPEDEYEHFDIMAHLHDGKEETGKLFTRDKRQKGTTSVTVGKVCTKTLSLMNELAYGAVQSAESNTAGSHNPRSLFKPWVQVLESASKDMKTLLALSAPK